MFQLNRLFGAVGQGAAALERCGVAGNYVLGVQDGKCRVPEPHPDVKAAGYKKMVFYTSSCL